MANLMKVMRQIRLLNLTVRCTPLCSAPHYYSTSQKSSSLTESRSSQGEVSTTVKKVKETTETVWNLGIIVGGLSITGAIFYVILKELFSSESPNNIYSAALDECIAHKKVQDVLGEPIKGQGEETRRGRHRHVSFEEYYDKDGKKGIRLRFYLKGSRQRATVYVDKKQNDRGKYEYIYIVVVPESIVPTKIFVIDNRETSPPAAPLQPDTNAPLPQLY